MPTGRSIVNSAWMQLPDDIRRGILSGDGGLLGRRAYKPIMRELFPSLSASDLYSRIRPFEDSQAGVIVDRIVSNEDAYRDLTDVIPQVIAQAAAGGYRGTNDPPFTRTIGTYFARRTPGTTMSEEEKSALVADVCAALLNAATGRIPTIPAVNDYFRDPGARARMRTLLDAVAGLRPPPDVGDVRDLNTYLDAVATSGKGVSVTSEGIDAWQRFVAVGGVYRSGDDDRSSGLSSVERTPTPELGGPPSHLSSDSDSLHTDTDPDADDDDEIGVGRTPPLMGSLYRRVHSVAKGATGRAWIHTLPSTADLVEREIAGFREAFQLSTPDGRAAVSIGLQAYLGSITDPRVLSVDRVGVTPEAAEALTSHRRWMASRQTEAARLISRRVASFLRGIDKDPTKGWMRLSQRSQDELSQLDRTLLPKLWRRVHNAQYRPDFFADGIQAWSLVYGQFVTLMGEIKDRHKQNPGGSGTDELVRLEAPGSAATSALSLNPRFADYFDDETDHQAIPFKFHRDERVRETLAELRALDGWDALTAFLNDARLMRAATTDSLALDAEAPLDRRRRLREAWHGATERIAAGYSTATVERVVDGNRVIEHLHPALAATWNDFIGYLDDHLGA